MNNLFDTKISYYSNVIDNVGTEISLRDFLFCDQYKEQIEYIRSISDEDIQKRLKLQQPVATISLVWVSRASPSAAHRSIKILPSSATTNATMSGTRSTYLTAYSRRRSRRSSWAAAAKRSGLATSYGS